MSRSAYLLGATPEKFRLLDERKNELKRNATPSEKYFLARLQKMGVRFIFQKGIIRDKQFIIADIYIPKLRLIVEIDGGYHQTEKQKKRDFFKDKYFYENNYHVLRIKNEDVNSFRYYDIVLSILQDEYTDYLKEKVKFGKNTEVHLNMKDANGGKRVKIRKEGQPCRNCGTPVVIKRSERASKFSHYFYCPNCKSTFISKQFRLADML